MPTEPNPRAGTQASKPAKPAPKQGPPSYKNQPGYVAPKPGPAKAPSKPGSQKATSAVTPTPVPSGTLGQFINAIMQEESGGNYSAVGPLVHGDHAYGKYQIMGANIPQWSKEILGHSITVQEYLNSPDLQEKIAQGKLTQYYNKYGAAGAASAWFTGSPTMYKTNPGASDGGTSAARYVNNVLSLMGQQPTTIKGGVGGGSGSGAGTGYAGAASTSDLTAQPFNEQDFASALASSGYAMGLIQSDKSKGGLYDIFKQAVSQKWDSTRFQSAVQNSNWYKTRTSAQRQWDELIWTDNAQAHRILATTQAQLKAQAAQMGVNLTDAQLTQMSHAVARNGLSAQEIQSMVGAQAQYKPGQPLGGTLGQSIDQLKQLSQQYDVPLSDQTLLQFGRNIIEGKADITRYEDWVKQQAISKRPWLKDQIDAGMTVANLADPYRQTMANLLEIDPASIKTNDPMIQKGLQYMDPQNQKAGYTTMPTWMFEQQVKNDPRWLQTNNARDSMMDIGTSVLRDMGLIT